MPRAPARNFHEDRITKSSWLFRAVARGAQTGARAAQTGARAVMTLNAELLQKAKARIATQFEPDGKQPEELQRTRGLWYAGFNLEALLQLAELGQKLGVDLYGFQTKDGRSLRRGIDYLAPYADPANQWPHQQINELSSARRELAYVLRRAALAYREPKYESTLNKYLGSETALQRWQLLWPPL